MAGQRSNSVLVFVAVLVAAVIVVYAITTREASPPGPSSLSDQGAEPPEPPTTAQPEGPAVEIDQTTETTYAPPTEPGGGEADPTEAPPATLHAAAGRGDVEAIAAMLGGGADLDARDGEGRTPLMLAAGGGHVDAVFTLLNAGADLRLRDQSRRSARDHALARYDQNGQTIARILGQAEGPAPVRDPGEK